VYGNGDQGADRAPPSHLDSNAEPLYNKMLMLTICIYGIG